MSSQGMLSATLPDVPEAILLPPSPEGIPSTIQGLHRQLPPTAFCPLRPQLWYFVIGRDIWYVGGCSAKLSIAVGAGIGPDEGQ
jgi:hypothetical protein